MSRRLAYADPPYPGQAFKYKNHPDYAGEVDHARLIATLETYDAWALSTSAAALQSVLALCPPDVRVAIWHIRNAEPPGNRGRWWWSWEPVILRGPDLGRCGPAVRNLLSVHAPKGWFGNEITGQKPIAFCRWVFTLLGAQPDDTLVDLFPGSGQVGKSWEAWAAQSVLSSSQ